MKNFLLLLVMFSLVSFSANSQSERVIELEPFDVVPTDHLFSFSNFSKKLSENQVHVKSKTSIVTNFLNPKDSAIKIVGIELFFNYNWSEDTSGFYVQPVIISEENSIPGSSLFDISDKYWVSPKLDNALYFDLSSKNIVLEPNRGIFLGLKFVENLNPDLQNSFNITFVNGKLKEYTFLIPCEGCDPQELSTPGKKSSALKFLVVYEFDGR